MVTNYLYSTASGWDPELSRLQIMQMIFQEMTLTERRRALAYLKDRFAPA